MPAYEELGVPLGELKAGGGGKKEEMAGAIDHLPAVRAQRPLVAAAARPGDGDGIGLDAGAAARAAEAMSSCRWSFRITATGTN